MLLMTLYGAVYDTFYDGGPHKIRNQGVFSLLNQYKPLIFFPSFSTADRVLMEPRDSFGLQLMWKA